MARRIDAIFALAQRPFDPLLGRLPEFLRPFLDFRGRSQRSDIITYIIAAILVGVAAYFVGPSMESRIITPRGVIELSGSGTPAEPILSVTRWFMSIWFVVFLCRRLHDQDRSAAYLLIYVAIFWFLRQATLENQLNLAFTAMLLLVTLAIIFRRGTVGPNRFGADPRGWESPQHYEREQVRLKSGNI
jgi:uncharacterized membrane protein YhaH (DUF805 family)